MKKMIILLSLFLMSINAFSNEYSYKASLFSSHLNGCEWSEWLNSDVVIKYNPGNKKIEILSSEFQNFRIISKITKKIKNGHAFLFKCLDSKQNECVVGLYTCNNEYHYVAVIYEDHEFIYSIIKK